MVQPKEPPCATTPSTTDMQGKELHLMHEPGDFLLKALSNAYVDHWQLKLEAPLVSTVHNVCSLLKATEINPSPNFN